MATRRLQVPKGEKVTLEKFLVRALPNADAARVNQLLARGAVRVNGKVAKAGRKTWGGETIELELPPPPPPRAVEGPVVPVLHETEAIIVVDKPSGFTVEPEPRQVSVAELLAFQRGGFETAGTSLPGVVHRLDKETSGCLAFGKSDEAVKALLEGFEQKRIAKRYLAFVFGSPPAQGSFDTPYAKGPDGKYTTRLESPRRARLSWTVRERYRNASLLEIELDTGRTHQIRVQFADAGFWVLGDRLYGQPFTELVVPRVALHASRLELDLPGVKSVCEAPFPAELEAIGHALER